MPRGTAPIGGWKAVPGVATNRDEVLAAAGSRYTYSANTMAYDEAVERGSRTSPSSA
jgi:coenzyme F420 hydrogenase subunit beta